MRNKTFFAGFLIASLSMLSACGTQFSQLSATNTQTKSRADIASELAAKPDGENVIWSAASLDALLALVGLGYDNERRDLLTNYLGTSIEKSAKASALLNIKRDGLTLQSANNIWTRKDFILKAEYKTLLADLFKGLTPKQLDVSQPQKTADDINAWISDNTNQMIQNAVTPDMITPDLAAMLANALYFKGNWAEEFDPKLTKDLEFTAVNKTSGKATVTKVATMQKHARKIHVGFLPASAADMSAPVYTVRLPYKGDTHAMYIAFATAERSESYTKEIHVDATKDVADVYRKYIVEGKAFSADYSHESTFDVFTMPKFTIESELKNIQDNLSAAGYASLFSQGVLSRMSADPRAQLSFILQKAKIIVNEEGSEAAAVTIGGIRTTSVPMSKHLKINGPFAYAIRDDKSGVTLFEGVVRNPAGK